MFDGQKDKLYTLFMIEPVRNIQGRIPDAYKQTKVTGSDAAPFSLGNALEKDKEGVLYDKEKDSSEDKILSRTENEANGGVYYTPSGKAPTGKTADTPKKDGSVTGFLLGTFDPAELLKKFIDKAGSFLKEFPGKVGKLLSDVWSGGQATESDSTKKDKPAGESTLKDKITLENSLSSQSIISNDALSDDPFDRMVSRLEQEELDILKAEVPTPEVIPSAIPARNTSILTQYDARGRITTPGPSDTQRILHTDKNVKKL